MRYILTAFLFAIILTPISAFSQADTTFTVEVGKYNKFDFRVYKGGDLIKEITYAVHSDDNSVNQPYIVKLTDDDFAHYIEFDDYNFDGYLDMYVHDPCMILGNCFGKIYLFDGEQFRHDPRFDDMTTVTAIPESRSIFSSNRSAASTLFTNETFQWEGDDLVLVRRVSQNLTEGDDIMKYLYKIEERDKNGNLVTVEEKILDEPNLE